MATPLRSIERGRTPSFRQVPHIFSRKAIRPMLAGNLQLKITQAKQRLAISSVGVETTQKLQMKSGGPEVEIRRVATDSGAHVVYLAELQYPARHLGIETTLL